MTGGETERPLAADAYRKALFVVLVYATISALWILFSDLLLGEVSPHWATTVSILKGLGFVAVTSILLHHLLRRYIRQMLRADQEYREGLAQAEQQKRLFFQNTIAAVTQGKLLLFEADGIESKLPPRRCVVDVKQAADAVKVREAARETAESLHFPPERIGEFVVAVGEAVTNAIKHANGGEAAIHADADHLWVSMTDRGQGIADLILPRVALERGFTTKPSLGMGYTLMLSLADQVYLSTGPGGTRVALGLWRQQAAPDSQQLFLLATH